MTAKKAAVIAVWIALAAPALYQLFLLATAISGRVAYPYDLEWMEGGLLHHAWRLQHGHGIYAPPSVDFIPYLYTPLYPALLAALGKLVGLGYTLGRVVSVISLVALAPVAALSMCGRRHDHRSQAPAWAGVALAGGLFAAVYPFVEGWYDLVRADTFFLLLATAGIAAAAMFTGTDRRSHVKVGAIAAVLVLSFLAKQTGIFYVALAGAIIAVRSWRHAATYTIVATILGVGSCVVANLATDGWFWIYVSKIHRAHDFNMDRFWRSFGYILWHFRALTIVIAVTLAAVTVLCIARRAVPRQVRPFLLWTSAFAVSTVVGAIGWGTEFAHFNAYIPAFLHGALAAGAALPALHACGCALFDDRPNAGVLAHAIAAAFALALALTLIKARWQPRTFTPTTADVAAGDKLVARIAAIDGEVWIPSHPWYAVLAGKTPYVHRMGVKDVTTRQTRHIDRLDGALRSHRWAAIFLDDHDLHTELPIGAYYRAAMKLPADERPHVHTGASVTPDSIWLPALPATPPPGVHVVFDFEHPLWAGWKRSGAAWGDGPADQPQPGQDLVVGATGARFATSMHSGDTTTGRVTSPPFALAGSKLSLMLGGGTDATKLRVELWVGEQIARTASVPAPGGDTLHRVDIDLADLAGQTATLVLVDDDPHGHLDVDDVWLWP